MRGCLFLAAWTLAACGPPPRPIIDPAAPPAAEAIVEDAGVDVARARAILKEARAALEDADFARARKLATDAEPYADEDVREEIRAARQTIDERVAKTEAPKVLELAAAGSCQQAAESAAAVAASTRGTAVVVFLRAAVSKPVLECLMKALAIDTSIGRELAENAALRVALEPAELETWQAQVDAATVGVLVEALGEPMRRRDWVKAVRGLDEMVRRKEAGAYEVAKVMKIVRLGIAEDVEAKAKGLGVALGAGSLLAAIDKLIEAGRWDAARGEPVPEALSTRREQAAFWAVCAAQGCRLKSPAEPAWAFGRADVRPLSELGGEATAHLAHARKVWRVADGRSFVLVAEKDPGALDSVIEAMPSALGWVSTGSIRPSDTSELLPPGESIVGARVWGAFRPGQKAWELGVVVGVKGAELEVERVADRKVVKAQRNAVRFGTVRAGTKVLADCGGKTLHPKPATIDEVVAIGRGDLLAKVTCLDDTGAATGPKQEVQLGSLRAEPRDIP